MVVMLATRRDEIVRATGLSFPRASRRIEARATPAAGRRKR
jgi:hypothetical protein